MGVLTAVFFATTVFLAAVLGFILYAKYTEVRKHREDMEKRYDRRWTTVFDRTDLRKAP